MERVHLGTQDGKGTAKVKGLVGPLTLRDTMVIAGAVLVLVGSLIPIPWTTDIAVNMWIFPGLPFHLLVSLFLPLGVGAAFAWRRFTNRTRLRVGSLSLDQAGSIVSMIALAYFFNSYVATMSPAYLLGLVGAIAMICGTSLARYFGAFRKDFVPGDDSVITADVRPVAVAAPKAGAKDAAGADDSAEDSDSGQKPAASPFKPAQAQAPGVAKAQPGVDAHSAKTAGAAGAAAAAAAATAGATNADLFGKPASSEKTTPTDESSGSSAATNAAPAKESAPAKEAAAAKEPREASATTPLAAGRQEPTPETGGAETAPEAVDESRPAPEQAEAPARPKTMEADQDRRAADAESAQAVPDLLREDSPAAAERSTARDTRDTADAAAGQAQAAPNATAAISREELAAAAARQKEKNDEPFGARSDDAADEAESSSFWFAVNQPRPVYDQKSGAVVTTLQPGIWILCLEDRGDEYLVNLDGDHSAVLRDLENLQFPEN